MKFAIKTKGTMDILFEAEIDCEENASLSLKTRLAVIWGYRNNKSLSGADLRGADLRGAYLSGADLSGAYLSGAYLNGADLRGAYLNGAYLNGADLNGADLNGADLNGADLSGADLGKTNIRIFKHDLWGVLLRFNNEIPELIKFIKDGKIDGSCYSGDCSCLVGTIATVSECSIEKDRFESIKDSNSPIERWFAMIKPGNTPENNYASKMALEWIEEFTELYGNRKDQ